MSQKESALYSLTTEMTPKIDENETAFSLRSRDYKDPQCVAMRAKYGSTPVYDIPKCEVSNGS